jgi:hypothetical protein
MFLLELDALLKRVFFVGVNDELCIRGVDRLSVSGYLDAGGRVRYSSDADDDLQLSTTFLRTNLREA